MQKIEDFPSVISEPALKELVGGPEVDEENGHVGDLAADKLDEVPAVVMQNWSENKNKFGNTGILKRNREVGGRWLALPYW